MHFYCSATSTIHLTIDKMIKPLGKNESSPTLLYVFSIRLMSYFLNLFSPETWDAFRGHGANVSGFQERQRNAAEKIQVGDILLCYMVRVSRWCGVLQVTSTAYRDEEPIYRNPDPFVIRFKVKPIVMLEPEYSIPIHDDSIWNILSQTKGHSKSSSSWTYRNSLREINTTDGSFLVSRLKKQEQESCPFPYTPKDLRKLKQAQKVQTITGEVLVEVPDSDEAEVSIDSEKDDGVQSLESRQSLKMQAKIAEIGAQMNFYIWVPRNDKVRVLSHVRDDLKQFFLDELPLNYDETTFRTIEQIDVIWIKRRSIARAFEVEHTTAVYSGLLRMADLLALQPNMDIRLHIVASDDRREKVLQEIRRPVFSLLERGPLYKECTFLSYNSVEKLSNIPHLSHTNDSILQQYEESAEE